MLKRIMVGLVGVMVAVSLTGCGNGGDSDFTKSRKDAVKQRSQTFNKAERVAPVPSPTNFPLRKALVEFTNRQDLENHPWYIYILGMNGNVIGYYVGKTVPVNACNFLSSTQVLDDNSSGGRAVLTAPSLDGMYYGEAQCDAWFFFDQATNALIQIRGVNFYAADKPLRVDAQAIKVQ